jgi:hypothetical protein
MREVRFTILRAEKLADRQSGIIRRIVRFAGLC